MDRLIDLRSDTVTRPTDAMRAAMAKKDSLQRIKQNEKLIEQQRIRNESGDSTSEEPMLQGEPSIPKNTPVQEKKKPVPAKNTEPLASAALLSEEKKYKRNTITG